MREDGASELGFAGLEQGQVVPEVVHFGSELLGTFEQLLVEVPGIIDLPDHIV